MTEFIWMDGKYTSEINIPPIPDTMVPRFRTALAIGPTAAHLTAGLSPVEYASNLDLSYPDDSFDLIVAGDFCEVPPSYAHSSLSPGSGAEAMRQVARLLAPGGVAFLHVWHPALYAVVHHAQVLGSLSDVMKTPKALADTVTSTLMVTGPFQRAASRRQFEVMLPERMEKLAWHPAPGTLTAFLPVKMRELMMRYTTHTLYPNAMLVVRKRWPRVDSRGEWS